MKETLLNEKIELLKNASIFSALREQELDVVARYSKFYNCNQGEEIFGEGSHQEELYIIKEGEVLITKHTEDGNDVDLARFISGESFGELDLLDNAPRTVVAIAEIDTTLLIFPMKEIMFREILQRHAEIFARILHKLLATIAGRIRTANKLIAEKTPWIQDLKRQLLSDKLTGLNNRTFLEEDFANLLPGYGENSSLIILKPDNFKEINDTFGHEAGDKVLRLIADTIKLILRENDIGIRYRGDEFAIVLPDTGTDSAIKTAETLRLSIEKMDIGDITSGKIPRITVSMGISTYPNPSKDNVSLLNKALEKMFEARNSGGNRILP